VASFLIDFFIFFILCYVLFSSFLLRDRIKRDFFHPLIVCKILIIVGLLLPNYTLQNTHVFSKEIQLYIYSIALFFIVALDIVSILFDKRITNQINLGSDKYKKLTIFLLVLFSFGWLFRLYAMKSGMMYGTFLSTQMENTSYSNIIGQANNISTLSFFGYLIFKNSERPKNFVYVMMILELVWVFISGSKIAILYVMVPVLMIFNKRDWLHFTYKKIIIYVVVLLFIIKLSFTLINAYRVAVQTSVGNGSSIDSTLIVESIVGFNLFEDNVISKENSNSEILERLNWYGFFGLLIERDDLYEELWLGKTYLPIFTWWVPRFIWEDKGSVSIGKWYGKNVLGWQFDSDSEGAVTIWGDALLNFGFFGPYVISLLWIIFIIRIYSYLGSRGPFHFLALCSIYMRMILGLEQNLANSFVTIQFQVLFILFFWFCFKFFNNFKKN
jgi:hypothetical protein